MVKSSKHESKRLIKVNDDVFREIISDDGGCPLEWRQKFHKIRFKATHPEIRLDFTINEHNAPWRKILPLEEQVKAAPKATRVVRCTSIESNDRFLIFGEEGDGKDYFTLKEHKGKISITIKEGDERPPDETIKNSLFMGHADAYIYDVDGSLSDDGTLDFEFNIPSAQMEILVAEVRENPAGELCLCVAVLAYMCEVEAAFREYWMPKNLAIFDAFAFSPLLTLEFGKSLNESDENNAKNEGCSHFLKEHWLVPWVLLALILLAFLQ